MITRAIVLERQQHIEDTLVLVPDQNLLTGTRELENSLGPLTSLERDLLTLAASVFAIDLAAKREERERSTRSLHLAVPVVNYHALARHLDDLTYVLYFLSDDNWELEFLQKQGTPEPPSSWPAAEGKTLLFSGGLDSLAGAVKDLQQGSRLQLASHYTGNQRTRGSQKALFGYLKERYPNLVSWVGARLGGVNSEQMDFPADDDRESSQRTRSFMFLVVGAIAARRRGFHEVLMMAENGQMAIHLPLTAARLGHFSTHTAHPEFVRCMEDLLSSILQFPLTITNPFLYMTKAEVVATLTPDHSTAIPSSVSCWRSSRIATTHCGTCVPCLTRRIANEYNGIVIEEYARDMFQLDIGSLDADDVGKKNMMELVEFVSLFGSNRPTAELVDDYPELRNVEIDLDQAVDMYRRFAAQAQQVLQKYPSVMASLR